MAKQVILVEFSDALNAAVKIGIDWNTAHDILMKDYIPPMYEIHKREHCLSDFAEDSTDYDYSPETKKIMRAMFEQGGFTSCTMV